MTNVSEMIVSRESERQRAMLASDIPALTGLLDEELHYGHSTGGFDDKTSYLEKIASGANVYESLAIDVERVVELADGAAMALGTVAGTVRLPVKTVEVNNRFLTVWRLKDGDWRMVGHQTVAAISAWAHAPPFARGLPA